MTNAMEGASVMTRIGATASMLLLAALGCAQEEAATAQPLDTLLQTCAACHGPEGQGVANYPRLAGLGERYLVAQLEAFASGQRENAIMKPQAASLTAAQRQALARHFSGLSVKPSANTGFTNINEAGRQLAQRGRWEQGIPACVQCHGPDGTGIGEDFPALAGQPARYLQDQLEAWRSGKRAGDPMGLMTSIARSLKGEDLAPVAAYFASLPAVTESGHE
nr:c-type cytochrome [Alcanivorax sp. DP30]